MDVGALIHYALFPRHAVTEQGNASMNALALLIYHA